MGALFNGIFNWIAHRFFRDLGEAWRQAAVACGLSVVSSAKFPFYRLTAESDAVRVSFTEVGQKELLGTRVAVECTTPARSNVTLSSEGLWSLLEKSWGRSEFQIGDPSFDRAFLLGGSPTRLLALLDAETRATLWVLHCQGRLQIQGGTVAATYDDAKVGVGYDRLLAQMIAVAKRLGANTEVPAALAANARRDPVAAIRLKNLLTLIRDFSEQEVVAETIAAALGDSFPEIRLRAAMAAREDGHPVLIALAEDAAIDDECAAAAIAALGRRLDSGRAESILRRALRTRRLETALACIEAMGAAGTPESAATLRKVAAVERGRLAVAAARALTRVGTPAAEAALREALARDLAEVRIAAAEGLGRIGSAEAVPALRQAAGRSPDDRALERAVRQAIAEIHARLPGASPGQLSLAAESAGQVSLASVGGELSLSGAGNGQLSLTPLSSREATPDTSAAGARPHPDPLRPPQ